MIVLDANVLIGYLDGSDANHAAAVELLSRETDDSFTVNVITLAEVLVAPARAGKVDEVLAALRDLEVAEEPLPAAAALSLATLRTSTGLKMPDCCVLLTAETLRARLATFDAQLARVCAHRGLTPITS